VRACVCARICVCMHARVCTCMRVCACVHACMRARLCVCARMCVRVCVCGSHNSSRNRARNFDSCTKYNESVYLIGAYPLYIIRQNTMPAGLEERQLSIEHSIAQPDGSTPIDEISAWVTQG